MLSLSSLSLSKDIEWITFWIVFYFTSVIANIFLLLQFVVVTVVMFYFFVSTSDKSYIMSSTQNTTNRAANIPRCKMVDLSFNRQMSTSKIMRVREKMEMRTFIKQLMLKIESRIEDYGTVKACY